MKWKIYYLIPLGVFIVGILLFLGIQKYNSVNVNPFLSSIKLQVEISSAPNTNSSTLDYLKSIGYTDETIKDLNENDLINLINNNQKNITKYLERDINYSTPHFIGVGGKTWEFSDMNLEELNISIYQISNDEFVIFPKPLNQQIIIPSKYNWKATLNIDGKNISLLNNLTSLDLNKPIFFSIPKDINYFELSAGLTSTKINGTASSTATTHSPTDKFVITPTGRMVVAFAGTSTLTIAYSDNNGTTWTNLDTGITALKVGLLVAPNGTLMAYYIGSSNLFGIFSNDDGATWNSPTNLLDLTAAIGNPSCQSDSNNDIHCAVIKGALSLAEAFYTNNSIWNSNGYTVISNDTADNINEVDLEVDSNNNPWVVGVGTDVDDLEIWSPGLKGWGSANRTVILDSISYVEGRASDLTIRSINGVESLFIISTIRGRLLFANTTLNLNTSWTTQELSLTGLDSEPTSAVTSLGRVEILYSNSTTASIGSAIYQANSTNRLNFNTSILNTSGANFPIIADSHFPIKNRLDGTVGRLDYIFTDSNGNVWYDSYTFLAEAGANDCSCPVSGDWDINDGSICTLSTTCDLGGNDFYCSANSILNITGSGMIKDWATATVINGCEVKCRGTNCLEKFAT